jgi:GT2 family glycosyltransferase
MRSSGAVAVRQYAWVPGTRPIDIDLGLSRDGARYRQALLLVEFDGVPWGLLDVPAPDGVVHGNLVEKAANAKVRSGRWPSIERLTRDAPAIRLRVVIPTCNDAKRVVRAVASVLRTPDADLEVVVVENRPRGSTVEKVLWSTFPDEPRLTYREEARPGLSRARNRGAEGATDGLIGFIDDDTVAHPFWTTAMRAAAAGDGECPVGVLAGRILPLGLENEAQLLFHRFTGFGEQDVGSIYRLDRPPDSNRLFPYAPGTFGSGACLCLPAPAFAALGGFDSRLGTGTPARGGEDLDMFVRALYAGFSVRYVPEAIIWHDHPDSLEELPAKMFGYGVGLAAMLTKHAVAGPDRIGFARRIPWGLRHLVDSHSTKNSSKSAGFPLRFNVMEFLGLLVGPIGYSRSTRQARAWSR